MKAILELPLRFIIGKLFGLRGRFYARVFHGRQLIQRCPRFTKPPSAAQLRCRQLFKERYGYKGHPAYNRGHPISNRGQPSTEA